MFLCTYRHQDVMVGEEAQAARSFLEIVYPMECGKITHWDEMELLWDYSFKKLQLDPANTKILLTEPPMNPLKNRQHMLQVLAFFIEYCYPFLRFYYQLSSSCSRSMGSTGATARLRPSSHSTRKVK